MQHKKVIDTLKNINKEVSLIGRVQTIRDHGKITFIDLSDQTGTIQLILKEKIEITPQSILEIKGMVKKRPENLINRDIETGTVEVQIIKVISVSISLTPPFPIEGD